MPLATPASILSSEDRRSWRAAGWSVTVAVPAPAVVVFMLQHCRRQVALSIRISPDSHPGLHPEGIRVNPRRGQGGRRRTRPMAAVRRLGATRLGSCCVLNARLSACAVSLSFMSELPAGDTHDVIA